MYGILLDAIARSAISFILCFSDEMSFEYYEMCKKTCMELYKTIAS